MTQKENLFKRNFISNTISNVIFNLLTQIIGFFIVPIFVLKLGPELYGIWILSRTIMGYFQLLDLGVSGGIVKYISEDRAVGSYEEIDSTINTSIIFYGIIGVVVFVIVMLFTNNILSVFNITASNKSTAISILQISAVYALFSWPNMAISSTMDGLMKYIPKNVLLGINSILNSIIILLLVQYNYSLERIVIISSLTNIIQWVGNYIVVKKTLIKWKFTFKSVTIKKLKNIFGFSVWVFVQQLIVMAVYQTDQIIIGLFLPVASITIYIVVTKLFYLVRQLNGMFLSVIWPVIFAANKTENNVLIDKMINKGSRYISLLIVPLSTLGFCISKHFIKIWMGEGYAQYAHWSQLLFAIWFFAPMYGVFGNVMVGIGKIKVINLMGAISTLINLMIGIILTKYFEIGGVILGTVISYIIIMPIQFPIFMKILKQKWTDILFPNMKIIGCNICFMLTGYMLLEVIWIESLERLFLFSSIYLIANYIIMFILFLDSEEKMDIIDALDKIKLGLIKK